MPYESRIRHFGHAMNHGILSLVRAALEFYDTDAVTKVVLQRVVLTALLLGGGKGIVAAPTEPINPQYDDRPLSYWLLDLAVGAHPNEELRARSEQAVRSIGTNAIPFLIGRFVDTPVDPHASLREAVAGFEVLGPIAQPAVPQLIELLPVYIRSIRIPDPRTDWPRAELVYLSAVAALDAIGPDVIVPLTNALSSGDADLRESVLGALTGFIKTRVPGLTDILLRSLEDPSPEVRSKAATCLGRSRSEASRVVPALIELTHDSDTQVSINAIGALGGFGAEARSAVPRLLAMARGSETITADPFWMVTALQLASALRSIDVQRAIDVLSADLEHTNAAFRMSALGMLRHLGPEVARVRPELLRTMARGRGAEPMLAGGTLKSLGTESLPGLIELLNSTNAEVRFEAVRTIGSFGDDARPVLVELERMRSDPDESVRNAASSCVRSIGTDQTPDAGPPTQQVIRYPIRVAADDFEFTPPLVAELEPRLNTALEKLRDPRLRLAGFAELIDVIRDVRRAEDPASIPLTSAADQALCDCPELMEIIDELEVRLEAPETRLEALGVLLNFNAAIAFGYRVGPQDTACNVAGRRAMVAAMRCIDVDTVSLALESPDFTVRSWAVGLATQDWTGQVGWEQLVPKLKRIAVMDRAHLRGEACEALRWFPDTQEFVTRRLEVESSPWVLLKLCEWHAKDYRGLFLTLFNPLLEETDERIRCDALSFIFSNASAAEARRVAFSRDTFDLVVELTNSGSDKERAAATTALGVLTQFDAELRRNHLLRLSRDSVERVRHAAVWGLAKDKEVSEVRQTLQDLMTTDSPGIRYSVVMILGATNHMEVLEELSRGPDARVAADARSQLDWIRKGGGMSPRTPSSDTIRSQDDPPARPASDLTRQP
jgi:HEAT repeat protein